MSFSCWSSRPIDVDAYVDADGDPVKPAARVSLSLCLSRCWLFFVWFGTALPCPHLVCAPSFCLFVNNRISLCDLSCTLLPRRACLVFYGLVVPRRRLSEREEELALRDQARREEPQRRRKACARRSRGTAGGKARLAGWRRLVLFARRGRLIH